LCSVRRAKDTDDPMIRCPQEGEKECAMMDEFVLFFLKPDAVARRYVSARTLDRLLETGLHVEGFKMVNAPRDFLANQHYAIHKGRFFYEWLVDYVSSGPVMAVQLRGADAVSIVRQLLGATLPAEAGPDTIRGRYGIDGGLNVAHASDSPDNGRLEIEAWAPLLRSSCEVPPETRLRQYISRYLDTPMIDPLRYRELFAQLSAGTMPPEDAQIAVHALLAKESDVEDAALRALVDVMVASASVRRPEGG
jgi:nucleoside-diphosphate kinase